MAAPTPTARQTPVGIKLDDGYSSLITLSADPDISFWEIEVTGVGVDGGDPIMTTTMHNEEVRTKAPKSLYDTTDPTLTVAYDPVVYNQIIAQVNVNQTITETFPDGSTLCYYGYLKSFVPNARVEGERPTAEVGIVSTNYDPVNRVEAIPVLTNVAGT